MSIVVICPTCQSRFSAGEQLAGKQVQCPKCANPLQVPTGRSTGPAVLADDPADEESNSIVLWGSVGVGVVGLLVVVALFVFNSGKKDDQPVATAPATPTPTQAATPPVPRAAPPAPIAPVRLQPINTPQPAANTKSPAAETAGRTWLSDLSEQNAKAGWGKFGKNGNCGFENQPIKVGDQTSPKGLGLHPNGQVTYALNGRYKTFHAAVALNDSAGNSDWRRPLVYRVTGDGRLLWESAGITRRDQQETCDVNVEGVNSLKLTVSYCPYIEYGDTNSAHTVWLDPYVDAEGPPAGSLPPAQAAEFFEGRRDAIKEIFRKTGILRLNDAGRFTRADFIEDDVTDQDVALLAKIPYMELIHFNYQHGITDNVFLAMKDMPNLRIIEVTGGGRTNITGEGLVHLTGHPGIERLVLHGPLTDAGLVHVRGLPNLKQLEVKEYHPYDPKRTEPLPSRVTDKTLEVVSEISTLESLNVDGDFTDEGCQQLGKLKKLRYIEIDRAGDKTMKALSQLPELQYLESGGPVTDEGLLAVSQLPKLQHLILYSNLITDAGAGYLANKQTLTGLGIASPRVTNAGIKQLGGLPLQSLDVFRTSVTGKGMAVIHQLPQLNWLSFRESYENADEVAAQIHDLPQLESLLLHECNLTNNGLSKLQNLPKLHTLILRNTKVDDAGLAHLVTLKNLTGLDVTYTAVTQAGGAQLQNSLPKCKIVSDKFFLPPKP